MNDVKLSSSFGTPVLENWLIGEEVRVELKFKNYELLGNQSYFRIIWYAEVSGSSSTELLNKNVTSKSELMAFSTYEQKWLIYCGKDTSWVFELQVISDSSWQTINSMQVNILNTVSESYNCSDFVGLTFKGAYFNLFLMCI